MRISSLAVATVAFFATSYFTRRWLEEQDIPKGMTRGALIFSIALAAAYGAAWIVGRLA